MDAVTIRTKRPPPFELFFAELEMLNPVHLERIRFAYIASKYGHAGQKREDGSRYFDHPKAAAWIYIHELNGRDYRVIILTLLHDLSEDTYLLSPYRIKVNFGRDLALNVRGLTKLHRAQESTKEYLQRVIDRGWRTILAKLCDRLHNLRTMKNCSKHKQREQITETRKYHLPMLIPALRTHGGACAKRADTLERLINEEISAYKG